MSSVKTIESIISDDKLKKQLKELVLERINTMPKGMKIAIGHDEIKSEVVAQHVEDEDDVGLQMMELELEYLRAISQGEIYSQ